MRLVSLALVVTGKVYHRVIYPSLYQRAAPLLASPLTQPSPSQGEGPPPAPLGGKGNVL